MSTSTFLEQRKAVPVYIGDMLLYCESFTAEAERTVAEKSTVDGDAALTNTFPRRAKLTLTGRVFNEEEPLMNVLMLNDMLRSASVLTVEYRGLYFGNCRILSYKAADTGKSFLDLSLTLSSDNIYIPEE
ncbi:MAG: hypothetical protein IKO47_04020 [Ruminococcus sp.]|nr:hypothetical protein [Ruminococcus sp.]